MKLKIITLQILACGLLLQQVTAQPTWRAQESPVDEDLISVSFADSSVGWAVSSNGKIIHTANGGQDWELITTLEGFYPEQLFFQNQDNGWMVGSYTSYLDTSYVMRTSDGGQSWKANYKRIASKLNDIYFVSDSVGFAVGFEGDTLCLRMKTVTAGQYWLDLKGPKIISEFYSVHFRDTSSGVMCGSGPTLQFTNNGGIKPPGMAQSIFNFEKEMFDLVNVGSVYGCMVGADGKLWFTKDNWNNFINYDFTGGDTLRAVDGLAPLSFYVVGDEGTILVVGYNQFLGLTAQDMSFDTDEDLLAIDAVDDSHIWAVGKKGTILFFGDDSGTGQSGFKIDDNHIIKVYPNPAKSVIHISSGNEYIKQIELTNLLGQIVLKKKVDPGSGYIVDISEIFSGIYFLRIKTDRSESVSQLIIY